MTGAAEYVILVLAIQLAGSLVLCLAGLPAASDEYNRLETAKYEFIQM